MISFINKNEINIHFVLGGEEGKTNTGLTVQIEKYKHYDKKNRKTPSLPSGESLTVHFPAFANDHIFIIMEPVLQSK